MARTKKSAKIPADQNTHKACMPRSSPIMGEITNFFSLRKRKNMSGKKGDVEVLGKRLRSEVNITPAQIENNHSDSSTPLGIFNQLPYDIFDSFAENAPWHIMIRLAQTSRACCERITEFLPRQACTDRVTREASYCRDVEVDEARDSFHLLSLLIKTVISINVDCKQRILESYLKTKVLAEDGANWCKLFAVLTNQWDLKERRRTIEFLLDLIVQKAEGLSESPVTLRDALTAVISSRAGSLPLLEMKIREYLLTVLFPQSFNDELGLSCLLRTFPQLCQQARILMLAYAPTMINEDGKEVINWLSLCNDVVTSKKDADLRISPFAKTIVKLYQLKNLKDRSVVWSTFDLFNLIEEISTCPEPWSFDNFIAFLATEPSLIPIALTARMTHNYVEEAGTLLSSIKTMFFRWHVPLSNGLSDAFVTTMKSLDLSLRREFFSSIYDANARAVKELVRISRRDTQEELSAQAHFAPLLQEVAHLL